MSDAVRPMTNEEFRRLRDEAIRAEQARHDRTVMRGPFGWLLLAHLVAWAMAIQESQRGG